MADRRLVLVQVDDYIRPPLWLVPTAEERAEEEERGRRAIAAGGHWVPGLSAAVERDPDTGLPVGVNDGWPISVDLKSRLNAWADAWEESVGLVDEQEDVNWLRQGVQLAAEVQNELGSQYDVVFGHGSKYSGEPAAGRTWPKR